MNFWLAELSFKRMTKRASALSFIWRGVVLIWFLLGAAWFHWNSVRLNLNASDSVDVRSKVLFVFAVTIVVTTVSLSGGVLRNLASFFPNERKQKTLSYLLMTPLTNWEILLGILVGELWKPIWMITATAPLCIYLSAYADYDPRMVLIGYASIVSTLFFVGSLSLVCSSTKSETAAKSQGLASLWLFLLMFLSPVIEFGGPRSNRFIFRYVVYPINERLYPLNPLSIAMRYYSKSLTLYYDEICSSLLWTIFLQATFGLILLSFKARRLRLDFQESFEDAATNRPSRLAASIFSPRKFRTNKRRRLGSEDAMIWKETNFSYGVRRTYLWGVIAAVLYLSNTYLIPYMSLWDAGLIGSISREFLRYGSIAMFFVTLSTASASIVAERSAKTWESLIVTDLTPREIIRGKIVGAFLCYRAFWIFLFVLAAFLCLIGELHWLSLILLLLESVVFSWFVASIGVFVSLITAHDASTEDRLDERAAAIATFVVIAQNLLFLLCCSPLLLFMKARRFFYIGFIPAIVFATIVPRHSAQRMLNFTNINAITTTLESAINWIATIGIDLLLSRYIFRACVVRFDAIVGRPRRKPASSRAKAASNPTNVENDAIRSD
jgi:hypothetical protein